MSWRDYLTGEPGGRDYPRAVAAWKGEFNYRSAQILRDLRQNIDDWEGPW